MVTCTRYRWRIFSFSPALDVSFAGRMALNGQMPWSVAGNQSGCVSAAFSWESGEPTAFWRKWITCRSVKTTKHETQTAAMRRGFTCGSVQSSDGERQAALKSSQTNVTCPHCYRVCPYACRLVYSRWATDCQCDPMDGSSSVPPVWGWSIADAALWFSPGSSSSEARRAAQKIYIQTYKCLKHRKKATLKEKVGRGQKSGPQRATRGYGP